MVRRMLGPLSRVLGRYECTALVCCTKSLVMAQKNERLWCVRASDRRQVEVSCCSTLDALLCAA
jgi:hypothetical protein